MLYPLFITISSAVLTITAAVSATKAKPQHPLVGEKSAKASAWFGGASVLYLGAVILILLEMKWLAVTAGLIGLIAAATGFALSSFRK
ncbi:MULTISPECIES: hypothetical protein [Corynebacterium]|uniref:Secreted protein n=1 Tax=Corynebacterium ramonii TaxID=3026968 RepID=A0ABM5RRR5_9CORY|nr:MULTISPECIES: hypothetical protein [Corynebacterium]AIU32647.1 Hypothetical protein CulFRC11_1069 [Corynebacterium ramonii FRC0011]ESU58179.1 hypothetical protein D881_06445 [Corynebacterium ulcerans NCTC 12077]STC75392.1 Uncharacterised protein [Corynebacterium ulcerans]